MGVTALVMAGGRGTRMKLREEKPLLKVGDKPIIQHVLDALKNAEKVDEIVVVVSKHTPKTGKMLKKSAIQVLEMPGKDYISDTQYAIKRLKLNTVVTISADLPLITSEVIDEVIEHYKQCGKPALAVVVSAETRERLGLKVDHVFEEKGRRLVPAGLNVIDGKRIDNAELEQETLIVNRKEIAVNINTLEDLKVAERLFNRLRTV